LRWSGPLWTYIDVRDAAVACRLAVEASFAGHEPFNICAPKTLMETPTSELAAQYLPTAELRTNAEGNWAGYDSAKSRRMLGFSARYLLE
jgi:nucleoside-diphosphate-sugar epimerase